MTIFKYVLEGYDPLCKESYSDTGVLAAADYPHAMRLVYEYYTTKEERSNGDSNIYNIKLEDCDELISLDDLRDAFDLSCSCSCGKRRN